MPELRGVEHRELELATGVRVHVALAGPPDAPPVLALHGWPQHWWCWRRVIEALGGRARIACADLRGFGWSPEQGDISAPRFADDAIATLDALGWERAVLAGHDWGGVAAWLVAVRAPERLRGVLVLGVPHPWQPLQRLAVNVWRLAYQLPLATPLVGAELVRRGVAVETALKLGWGEEGMLDAAELETYLAAYREPGAAHASEALYRWSVLYAASTMRSAVSGRHLEMPARLLVGRREPLGTALAEGLEHHGDDAATEILDGAGHFLPEERPAVVAERIVALATA